MGRPDKQRLTAIIVVNYDAEVFDGDPEDAFDFADIEKATHEAGLDMALTNILGDVTSMEVTITPAVS